MECIWNKKSVKRGTALVMAAVLLALAVPFPLPARASSVWPQKATAPFYCLDGGRGWKQVDRYDIYEYDTLPSPLTETQTKRLFWAYPSNWTALKEAFQCRFQQARGDRGHIINRKNMRHNTSSFLCNQAIHQAGHPIQQVDMGRVEPVKQLFVPAAAHAVVSQHQHRGGHAKPFVIGGKHRKVQTPADRAEQDDSMDAT